jgi:NodT family efflux transporter outer membrane factor (OMF) lipoprotein
MMTYTKSRAILLAAAIALSGCEVGPNYKVPTVAVPTAFSAPVTTQPSTAPATQSATQRAVDMASWWQSLGDPELDRLVEGAVEENFDVNIALMRLQEARASAFVVAGGIMPFVEASGAAARGSGNNSIKSRVPTPLNAGTNTTGLKEITQVVGFDAGWELDLFGRFRRQLEAAEADTQAATEARNAVLISVIGDVARAYIDFRTAQERLHIAQDNIAIAKQSLDVVQQLFGRGLTAELDVALARRQLATEQSGVAPLEEDITQAERRLEFLLGREPGTMKDELATAAELPTPPMNVITGIPADLLRRRPDIRQAERQLAAENARIGVATADLFPRVAITAGVGLQGQGLGRVPTVDSFIWSVGPTAVVPLLDFGRIDSMIMLEDLRTRELFYNYERKVIGAVEEVDDAAGRYSAEQDRLKDLREAIDASKRAVELANGRYQQGLIDFLNVLDAQRQLFALQDEYTIAQQEAVTQYVAVYKALGGGWENYQRVPQLRTPLPAVLAAIVQTVNARPNPTKRKSDFIPPNP